MIRATFDRALATPIAPTSRRGGPTLSIRFAAMLGGERLSARLDAAAAVPPSPLATDGDNATSSAPAHESVPTRDAPEAARLPSAKPAAAATPHARQADTDDTKSTPPGSEGHCSQNGRRHARAATRKVRETGRQAAAQPADAKRIADDLVALLSAHARTAQPSAPPAKEATPAIAPSGPPSRGISLAAPAADTSRMPAHAIEAGGRAAQAEALAVDASSVDSGRSTAAAPPAVEASPASESAATGIASSTAAPTPAAVERQTARGSAGSRGLATNIATSTAGDSGHRFAPSPARLDGLTVMDGGAAERAAVVFTAAIAEAPHGVFGNRSQLVADPVASGPGIVEARVAPAKVDRPAPANEAPAGPLSVTTRNTPPADAPAAAMVARQPAPAHDPAGSDRPASAIVANAPRPARSTAGRDRFAMHVATGAADDGALNRAPLPERLGGLSGEDAAAAGPTAVRFAAEARGTREGLTGARSWPVADPVASGPRIVEPQIAFSTLDPAPASETPPRPPSAPSGTAPTAAAPPAEAPPSAALPSAVPASTTVAHQPDPARNPANLNGLATAVAAITDTVDRPRIAPDPARPATATVVVPSTDDEVATARATAGASQARRSRLDAQSLSGTAARTQAARVVRMQPGFETTGGVMPAGGVPRQPTSAAAGIAAPSKGAVPDAVARQLDLAQGSAWLDRLATDIAAIADGGSRMRFALAPERLGGLTVELASGSAGTAVRLTTETAEAHRILSDARPQLVAEARAQGLRIAEAQVDLGGGRSDGQPTGGAAGQSGGAAGQSGDGRRHAAAAPIPAPPPRARATSPAPRQDLAGPAISDLFA